LKRYQKHSWRPLIPPTTAQFKRLTDICSRGRYLTQTRYPELNFGISSKGEAPPSLHSVFVTTTKTLMEAFNPPFIAENHTRYIHRHMPCPHTQRQLYILTVCALTKVLVIGRGTSPSIFAQISDLIAKMRIPYSLTGLLSE